MSRDDKLREVVKQMRFGSPPRHVLEWADRIESALVAAGNVMPAETKESLEYMDEERKSCGHRHMHLYTKDFDQLRAWIRQVTGE